MRCRHCGVPLSLPLVDLGSAPPSNAYLTNETLHAVEKWFPLRVLVCESCWLVQTEDFARADELFDVEYAYFSGFSTSWLAHCESYVDEVTQRFHLNGGSRVVEVAANDGHLLQFVKARGIPCIGVEPTTSTASAARTKGIPIVEDFFGSRVASAMQADGKQADLTVANNVLAHVPDINDFVAGFSTLLKPNGVATFEFPHLLRLVEGSQFDTIYHEHFSYLSLTAVERIFANNGLSVFDVTQLGTHGGSLRVFAQRSDQGSHPVQSVVAELLEAEAAAGLTTGEYYAGFQAKAERIKNDLLTFLLEARRGNKKVVAYGAAAKGNTLLNFAGVRADLISYVVDKNPAKQGRYMPGSRIPIREPERLLQDAPDYLLVLPWNIVAEVRAQNTDLLQRGTRLVTAVPSLLVEESGAPARTQ